MGHGRSEKGDARTHASIEWLIFDVPCHLTLSECTDVHLTDRYVTESSGSRGFDTRVCVFVEASPEASSLVH